MERTFSIIKPDATARNITGKINAIIEENGLRIIAQKRIRISKELAGEFYAEHKGKPFYDSLTDFMSSGPIVVQVLEGENAILNYRKIMGATNPENADAGTIRKLFAIEMSKNTVHGSDGVESAKREINFFFNELEIIG